MRKITETIINTIGEITGTTKKEIVSSEGNSSIEITVDSKGLVKPTVKVYNDDPQTAKDMAVLLWNELKDQFGDNMLGQKSNG